MSPTPRPASPAPEHRKLFTYLFRVFGIDLYGIRPIFKNGLVIGDTFVSPEQARRLFATDSIERAPETTPPGPTPPEEPPVKPKRGPVQNKEDPAFDI